ncbi:Sulfate transporter CysZ [compost metagenome]
MNTCVQKRELCSAVHGDKVFSPDGSLAGYIDYPADNHKLGWNEMLAWLRKKRWQSLGFGGFTYLALMISFVNILMMPAAVAGATLFWVREGGDKALVK